VQPEIGLKVLPHRFENKSDYRAEGRYRFHSRSLEASEFQFSIVKNLPGVSNNQERTVNGKIALNLPS